MIKLPTQAGIDIDYSIWKIAFVAVFSAIFAGFFGYGVSSGEVGISIAFGLLFLACLTLQPLFIKGRLNVLLAALLQTAALGVPIMLVKSELPPIILGLGLAAVFLFIFFGQNAGRIEYENNIRIIFSRVTAPVLAQSFTALAIFIAVVVGIPFKGTDLISEKAVNIMVSVASPLVGYYIPGFNPGMATREVIAISAKQSLIEGAFKDWAAMPDSKKESIINQTVDDAVKSMKDSFGILIDPDKTLEENIRAFLDDMVGAPLRALNPLLVSAVAFAFIFLLIKGLGWVVHYPVMGFAFFLYQLALSSGFAFLTLETRSKEVIVLK